jgi:hypothetical protein
MVLNGEEIPPKIVLNIKVDPSLTSLTPKCSIERSQTCYCHKFDTVHEHQNLERLPSPLLFEASGVNPTAFDAGQNRLGSRADAEFAKNIRQVHLHRARRNLEVFGDLLVGRTRRCDL